MFIGKNIRKFREEMNITQGELAKQLNISYQAISKWENAQAIPDTVLLPKIANIFGVSIDELFYEHQENYANLADKLATIFENSKMKSDFLLADLAYERLFKNNEYSARDLMSYAYINWHYAWTCFHIAEDYFDKSMSLAVDDDIKTYRDALSWKICLKADMNQSDEMIIKLTTLCETDPDDILHRNALITAYVMANKIDEAESIIDNALSEGYNEWFLYQNKGDIQVKKGELSKALESFERAWAIDSETYCNTLYSIIDVYKRMDNVEKAIEYCNKWIFWYEQRGAIHEKKVPLDMIKELKLAHKKGDKSLLE